SLCPAIMSLSFGTIAGYTRGTRAELSEVLTNEFMLLARTKGLTKGQAVIRHAMRNSMVVIFPSILSEIIGLIGGSMIIEKIFSIPGLGTLYINAINSLDYNFFMINTAFYSLIGLLSSLAIDLSYTFIDPRIRVGAR
ncbi:MAG: ABC transporter permease, partial [Clostridia bacterium]|nr:ABC transporter permease [Clostridia bacterium]